MSNILLNDKINMVAEQILQIESCGFYTEAEIDNKTAPLYQELQSLEDYLISSIQYSPKGFLGLEKVEITLCQYFIAEIKNKEKNIFQMEVNNPQTLSA